MLKPTMYGVVSCDDESRPIPQRIYKKNKGRFQKAARPLIRAISLIITSREERVMTGERKEQLRERLLGDGAVRAAISLRAYDIYQRRGGEPGHEIEDWVQAEKEILEALIKEESQLGDESSAARVLQADTSSTAGAKKISKSPAAPDDKRLPSGSVKTAKSRAKPPAAKRAKSRKSTKSTAPRKPKVKAAQPPKVKAAQPPPVKEGAAGKTARLIKRKNPAGEQNEQD
jgi:hypothetical protein